MISNLSDVQSENIGEGTSIWQFCVILKNAIIGKNCNINCHVLIENDVIIGDNVTIKPGVQIWDGMRIGNGVFIGSNVTFTNDPYPRSKNYPESFKITTIEEGASIGSNVTILPGITIHKYAMIGAGSIVTKNVPPFNVWYGVPASHQGYINKAGDIIALDLKDRQGNVYFLENKEPILKK